jgi:cytochrome c oxidase subunit 4
MSLLIYYIVFAVLVGSTAGELAIIGLPVSPEFLVSTIIGLAGVKALLIAAYFQHLRHEPRALSSLLVLGLAAATVMIGISFLSIVTRIPHA